MKKRGRKPKAINVVKLTEKEREKFSKKFKCSRCYPHFYANTREELEYHMENLHGEYSFKKHRDAKGIDRNIHKLYMNRNKKKNKKETTKSKKLQLSECFGAWCKNCGGFNAIHADMSVPLQDDIVCGNCRMNIFKDNRKAVVNDMIRKGKTVNQYLNWCGIDTTKFKGYSKTNLDLRAKGKSFKPFLKKRKARKKK